MRGYIPHMWKSLSAVSATALVVLACSASSCVSDDDDSSSPVDDGGGNIPGFDAGDAAPPPDPPPPPDTGVIVQSGDDGGPTEDAEVGSPVPCANDDACQNGFACDGTEVCVAGYCEPGKPPTCVPEHPCVESLAGCDCTVPDFDVDGQDSTACGGDDCDDSNPLSRVGFFEVCDSAGVDEDCNPHSYNRRTAAGDENLDGDGDDDGFVSIDCFNVDHETGELHRGDDCRDNNPRTHPENTEVCDDEDNDCNGVVDEAIAPDGSPSGIPHSLREAFYPDVDHDGFGDQHGAKQLECGHREVPGYVLGPEPRDCDDESRAVHPGALEVCDGFDNDCDGQVDADDQGADGSPFIEPYSFTDTELECVQTFNPRGAHWEITQCPDDLLWCADVVDNGCTTDATALTTCGDCETDCKFACGGKDVGCDEIVQLSLGTDHSCARTSHGRAACWGRGADGRLGTDLLRSEPVAREVFGIDQVVGIAAGSAGSCAISGPNRELYCWGDNQARQLATDAEESSSVPLPVFSPYGDPVLAHVGEVAVSVATSCAVLQDGALLCWGSNAHGLLADGTPPATPPDSDQSALPGAAYDESYEEIGDALSVGLGERHGCVLTNDGRVLCWGANNAGQLGNRDALAESGVAFEVPVLDDVEMLAVGAFHNCALSAGQVSCWGNNAQRELGRDSGPNDDIPGIVEGLPEIRAVTAGFGFTCALDQAGRVHCWGADSRGQCGDPSLARAVAPTVVSLPAEATEIEAGGSHVCARVVDGRVFCWGHDTSGQQGTGRRSQQPQPSPRAILPLAH